jgi:hypothetical protein
MATLETARDRRTLAKEAGYGTTSFLSVLAGMLVALGAVALVMAALGAVGSQLGLDVDGISTSDWRTAGIAGAAVAAGVLFLAFFFGGYTAGRMSRRAGTKHGLLVFLLTAVVVAAVAGLAAWLGDTSEVTSALDDNGVPRDANTWSDIGIGAAIAAGVAMLLGSVLGGSRGDRWHGRLVTAATERRAEVQRERSERPRLGEDPTTIDLRDGDDDGVDDHHELSVEEERERSRTSH